MPALRICKTSNYTVVSNKILWDKRLSLKARGLLVFCLGLPDGWEYSIEGLVKATGEGRTSVASGIKELEEHGYLKRKRVYQNGKVCGIDYFLYEEPQTSVDDEPVDDIPLTTDTIDEIPVDGVPDFNFDGDGENLNAENLTSENLILDELPLENLKAENLILENQPQYNTNTLDNTNTKVNTKDLVITKEKEKKNKKKKKNDTLVSDADKQSYAEFVQLKPAEYEKLIQDKRLGSQEAVDACVELLNDFKGANGKKYNSDYYAIRRWVIDAYLQKNANVIKTPATMVGGKPTVAQAADIVRERLKGMKLNGLR